MRTLKFRAYSKELGMSKPTDFATLIGENTDFDEFDAYMQFTGLTDKVGVEIYEGDIVEEPGARYKVVYHADGFYLQNTYDPDKMLLQLRHGYLYCEVIGNIYENPDLLNAAKPTN